MSIIPIAHYKFGLSTAKSIINHGSETLTPDWHATSGSPTGPASVDANSIKLSSLYAFNTGVKMGRPTGHTVLVAVKLVEAQFCIIAGGGSQATNPNFNFGPQMYYLGSSDKYLYTNGVASSPTSMCDPGWQIIGYSLAANLSTVKAYGTGKYGGVFPTTTTSSVTPAADRILSVGGGNYAVSPSSTQHDFAGVKIWDGALTDAQVMTEIAAFRTELKARLIPIL